MYKSPGKETIILVAGGYFRRPEQEIVFYFCIVKCSERNNAGENDNTNCYRDHSSFLIGSVPEDRILNAIDGDISHSG